jgi:hypothetical protein
MFSLTPRFSAVKIPKAARSRFNGFPARGAAGLPNTVETVA